MSDSILSLSTTEYNTTTPRVKELADSPAQAFEQAFCSQENNNRIDLILFLTRRIVAFARLSMGACPTHRLFWQQQIADYHRVLKSAMTNPVFKAGAK